MKSLTSEEQLTWLAGKSQFFIGKNTFFKGPFCSAMLVCQGVVFFWGGVDVSNMIKLTCILEVSLFFDT